MLRLFQIFLAGVLSINSKLPRKLVIGEDGGYTGFTIGLSNTISPGNRCTFIL
jgi:hypothetical protein